MHLFISYVDSVPSIMTIRLFVILAQTSESYILFKGFKNPSRLKPSRKLLSPDLHFTIHYLLLLFALSEHCSLCTAVSYIYIVQTHYLFPFAYPNLKPKRRLSLSILEIMLQVTMPQLNSRPVLSDLFSTLSLKCLGACHLWQFIHKPLLFLISLGS